MFCVIPELLLQRVCKKKMLADDQPLGNQDRKSCLKLKCEHELLREEPVRPDLSRRLVTPGGLLSKIQLWTGIERNLQQTPWFMFQLLSPWCLYPMVNSRNLTAALMIPRVKIREVDKKTRQVKLLKKRGCKKRASSTCVPELSR